MVDFPDELARLRDSLEQHRCEVNGALAEFQDSDLNKARRGGWTIGKVLEHMVGAEWHYAQLVASLRGLAPPAGEPFNADRVALAADALERSREALLTAVQVVSEDDFYRLGTVGREEYSIASVLENADQHDIEHLGQIRLIQAETSVPA